MQPPLHDPGRHDPLHAGARPGGPGRAVGRHHHADRLRLRERPTSSVQQAIEARDADFAPKSCCDWAYHLMLSSEPPHTQFGELAEAIQAGYPTVKIFTTDIRPHRTGPHGRLRRHLGDVQGAGQGGRARRHPRRGQRHRHAHVRQADPRGTRRLREHGGGAQRAVGGPDLPPRDPARRERARHRALHDARVGRDRRCGDPRGARQGVADLRREPAPVHAATRPRTTSGRTGRSTTPIPRSSRPRIRRRCGPARWRAPSTAWPPTSCAARCARRRMGRRIDDTTGGNSGVEPRLGVMYTEMVVRRGYSLPRYVDLVSTNAAKIMGLYPRKGAIAVGSDADIAILDPTPARQGAQGGPARDRLHAMGGPRHLRLAGGDGPARQGRGGERAVPRPRRRGPLPQAQDPAEIIEGPAL